MNVEDLIKDAVRSVLRDELHAIVRELRLDRAKPQTGPAVYTVNELRAKYRAGRGQITELINRGTLPAIPRVMRGGRQGWVVRVEDAERVLGGAK